ncbi:MAG TPA: glycosyltransferase family 2 protein [Kiritimatiellia bacterium]|nr:glycosyltransferase family 2 protein [Kiritimatiellia bacterium]
MSLSVIVPVYRVPESMLKACLKSLGRQTAPDLEILLVADGADAATRDLLAAQARRDSRFRVLVLEKNQGVSSARNRGLEVARGDWIGFVDADDWIEPDMYARLAAFAEGAGCDLAGCGCTRETSGGGVRMDCPPADVKNINGDFEAAWAYANAKTSCWSKLFRRSRVEGLRFRTDLTHMEDAVFLTEALGRSERVGFLADPLYHVCFRPDSAHRRPMTLAGLRKVYQAFHVLAELGAARSQGTRWMRRMWAWRLLAWSLAARRYHDELPADNHREALEEIRRFYLSGLAPFHAVYPSWLRRMLERRLESADRFFGEPGWYYTLLWNRIRIGMRPFEERGLRHRAGDALARLKGDRARNK